MKILDKSLAQRVWIPNFPLFATIYSLNFLSGTSEIAIIEGYNSSFESISSGSFKRYVLSPTLCYTLTIFYLLSSLSIQCWWQFFFFGFFNFEKKHTKKNAHTHTHISASDWCLRKIGFFISLFLTVAYKLSRFQFLNNSIRLSTYSI